MPLIELELHPYLEIQLNNSSSLLNYNKLLVGTFPTYEVTKSKPVERLGNAKREHWPNSAVFKYFMEVKKIIYGN